MAGEGSSLRSVPPPSREARLDVAAVLEGTTHAAGIGWRLTTENGPGPVRSAARRHGQSRVKSELSAVRAGLADAAKAGCRRLVVYVPGEATARILSGEELPRYRRATAGGRRLRPLLARFESLRFVRAPSENAEVHQAAEEALDIALHRAAEREDLRAVVLEHVIERAKEVHLEHEGPTWVANGRYQVRLYPLLCDCPAWSKRWARPPLAARRAERLPCKHLVALALDEGITDPFEMMALARKATD